VPVRPTRPCGVNNICDEGEQALYSGIETMQVQRNSVQVKVIRRLLRPTPTFLSALDQPFHLT
jgi:hypothetical protein